MKRLLILIIFSAITLAPACGGVLNDRDELLAAVAATEHKAREFEYSETSADGEFIVKGAFEDDLRYRVLLAENNLSVLDHVVSDDVLAVKLHDPNKVLAELAPVDDPGAVFSLEALKRGEWVIDPSGAPPLSTASQEGEGRQGIDPIRDALKIFTYARTAIRESQDVKEWQEDDLFPAYVESEGKGFDGPGKNTGVKRFDLVRVPLPRAIGTTQEIAVRPFHFRKMVFYVKDGKVIRIVEEIDFASHVEFERARESASAPDLLELLGRLNAAEGEQLIRNRRMSLDLSKIGGKVRVEIPAGVTSPLAGLLGLPGAATGEEAAPAEAP